MIRTFPHPNHAGDWKCPICKSSVDGIVALIPIAGTEDGNNQQALQVHRDCVLLAAKEMSFQFEITNAGIRMLSGLILIP